MFCISADCLKHQYSVLVLLVVMAKVHSVRADVSVRKLLSYALILVQLPNTNYCLTGVEFSHPLTVNMSNNLCS